MNATDFLEMSRVLTGVAQLPEQLTRQYLDRLVQTVDPVKLEALGSTFKALQADAEAGRTTIDSAISVAIMGDEKLAPVAAQVIYIWYLSALRAPHPDDPAIKIWRYGSPEQHDAAVAWSVLNGHVPMTPGEYGFWSKKP